MGKPITEGLPMLRSVYGSEISILEPKPNDFMLEEIARGLSNVARYSGQTPRHYSVAEHSLHVSAVLMMPRLQFPAQGPRPRPDLALWGLMHDAAEAYLSDVPTPLKELLPRFSTIEETFLQAIAQRFSLVWPMPKIVKVADRLIYHRECQEFQRIRRARFEPTGFGVLSPREAEKRWLEAFEWLQTEAQRGES